MNENQSSVTYLKNHKSFYDVVNKNTVNGQMKNYAMFCSNNPFAGIVGGYKNFAYKDQANCP